MSIIIIIVIDELNYSALPPRKFPETKVEVCYAGGKYFAELQLTLFYAVYSLPLASFCHCKDELISTITSPDTSVVAKTCLKVLKILNFSLRVHIRTYYQ